MRSGNLGMGGSRAERSPRHGSSRGGADQPKAKPELKKIWPQVRVLVAPRKGLLLAGMALMAVNRLAGLVLPFESKALIDKVFSSTHPQPRYLPIIIAAVFSAMVIQAITSFSLTQLLANWRRAGDRAPMKRVNRVHLHIPPQPQKQEGGQGERSSVLALCQLDLQRDANVGDLLRGHLTLKRRFVLLPLELALVPSSSTLRILPGVCGLARPSAWTTAAFSGHPITKA